MVGAEWGHMAQGQVTQIAALLSHFLSSARLWKKLMIELK